MDFSKIRVPFIDKTEIKKRAIAFRQKYWDTSVPVNIERIIESKLGIEIIPVPGLVQQCNTDAFISSDWSSMHVDNERYLDERWSNRLRFSLAHEIGHWVLHRQLYASFEITDMSEMYEFLEKIPGEQYNYVETQANYFAGYVLVPLDILQIEREKALRLLATHDVVVDDMEMVHSYMAEVICQPFDVSAATVKILLDNEFRN